MSMRKLVSLFDDITYSMHYANTHMNIAMPAWLTKHARRHQDNRARYEATDREAAGMADGKKKPLTADERETRDMVDLIIRRSGLFEHYAGPKDLSAWGGESLEELNRLKAARKEQLKGGDFMNAFHSQVDIYRNATSGARRSLLTTAMSSAVSQLGDSASAAAVDTVIDQLADGFSKIPGEDGEPVMTKKEIEDYLKKLKE